MPASAADGAQPLCRLWFLAAFNAKRRSRELLHAACVVEQVCEQQ
jgi:hypothetical protein